MYAPNIVFPGGSVVKILSVMPEMWFQPLGQEDPLEKEMATHSSIPAWEIHGQRSLAGHSPWVGKRVRHDLVTKQKNNAPSIGAPEYIKQI